MAKQTKAEKIASIPIEEIVKMGKGQRKILEEYVKTLKSGYKRRVQSFRRQGLVSYAQIALEGTIPSKKKNVPIKKMTRNQLILEIARYSKFFNDKTSTVSGIKKINLSQDVRIFGKDSKGKPLRTMTNDEREKFWRLYEEYNNQNPNANSTYGSESIQQQLAEAIFLDHSQDTENIVSLLDRLNQELEQNYIIQNVGSVPGVYSGRGFTFSD